MMKSYLYSKNVRKNQISGKAYGETKIVNKCTNGITCSASDHKKIEELITVFLETLLIIVATVRIKYPFYFTNCN
jgi:hypothetical protein